MSIGIKDIVALTGAPGLHRIVKADDKAIIVESMDERKKRQMVRGNVMVSKLVDVSIYTDDESEPLVNILRTIKEKYGDALPVDKKSSKNDLIDFFSEVLPNFDKERVYASNIKKILGWYQLLTEQEIDWEVEEEEEAAGEAPTEETKDSSET